MERTTRPHTDAQVAAQSCEGARYILKVPLMIPSVPPWRTVRGPFAAAVLSRAEYDCFHHTWSEWCTAHPEYLERPHKGDLFAVCVEAVLQFRLDLLWGALPLETWNRLYHGSFKRQQAARIRLGATRRQRLARDMVA